MWTIIKIDRKKINFLKEDLLKKLGDESAFYNPKLLMQKYVKNKFLNKELDLLGDYFLCYHKDFEFPETLKKIQFCRGLKYILPGFTYSQSEIKDFINKCKKSENKNGYLSQSFFDLKLNKEYKFKSGPFAEKIFKIINFQKNKIDIFMGKIKTTVEREKFLLQPI